MIKEREELDSRIRKAKKAVKTPPYGMDEENIRLLDEQVGYMERYSDALRRRIEINKNIGG